MALHSVPSLKTLYETVFWPGAHRSASTRGPSCAVPWCSPNPPPPPPAGNPLVATCSALYRRPEHIKCRMRACNPHIRAARLRPLTLPPNASASGIGRNRLQVLFTVRWLCPLATLSVLKRRAMRNVRRIAAVSRCLRTDQTVSRCLSRIRVRLVGGSGCNVARDYAYVECICDRD